MLCIKIIPFLLLINHNSFSKDAVDVSNREKWKFCRLRSGGVQSFISGVILKFNLWTLFGTAISYLDFFCAL